MAMKKGWIVFFVVFGLIVFAGVMFVFAIAAMFDDTPVVRDNTVLRLNLAGFVTEYYPRDAIAREFEGASLQMHDIRRALEMAKVDDRIKGVYCKISFANLGWAKAQEVAQALTDFKESGKFVTTFLGTCDEKSYYVALASDEIYMQPHAYAELNGLAAEVPFYKRMFNKVGIEPQVHNIGKYKSAGDIYKRDSMSPAHRKATETILNDFFEAFVHKVVEVRSIARDTFIEALNNGLYSSDEIFTLELVDDLKYEPEVLDVIKKKVYGDEEGTNGADRKLRTMSISRYAELPPGEVGLDKGSRIALIYAVGTILPGGGGFDPLFGRHLGSSSLVDMIESAEENRSVKAIVLRVDSPGGSSQAADQIWSAIKKARAKKPVIVSMSDVAASGGYWLATASDAVVAQPLSITGSIGVVTTLYDLSGTYNKIGLVWETVKKGKHADVPTEKRPMTEEEWEIFKKLNREIYQVFVQKTADARDMSWNEVHEVAQGRVWTGNQALTHGLLDSLGGLNAALELAKEKADITDATRWLVYPQPKGLFESLFEKFNAHVLQAFGNRFTDLTLLKTVPTEIKTALRQIAVTRQLQDGQVMAIEPFVPVVH